MLLGLISPNIGKNVCEECHTEVAKNPHSVMALRNKSTTALNVAVCARCDCCAAATGVYLSTTSFRPVRGAWKRTSRRRRTFTDASVDGPWRRSLNVHPHVNGITMSCVGVYWHACSLMCLCGLQK
ncbi:unnamed protein product [Ectocarpus sp. 8 AP-2014]